MATAKLEPAIPPHLRSERTEAKRTPDDFEPPFPAYSARFPKTIKGLVMAIFGAQSRGSPLPDNALSPITGRFVSSANEAPYFWETATVVDARGEENRVVVAYWSNRARYDKWIDYSNFRKWWNALDPEAAEFGRFKEVFFPPIERFETVFSDNEVPEGAAHGRAGVSGQIREHVAWGSMRDRMPAAQTDPLTGEKHRMRRKDSEKDDSTLSKRIPVPGKQNLCIIRSGQDWSDTRPEERTLYLGTMHPVLVRGMDFLRDKGQGIGCYSCRMMSVLATKTAKPDTDRTFGLAYFDDMASLEKWSKDHETHLNIFNGFLEYAAKLQNNISLRLFHEVLVLESGQQDLEYIGCHSDTGMLTAIVV